MFSPVVNLKPSDVQWNIKKNTQSTKLSDFITMKQQNNMKWRWLNNSSSCLTWDVSQCCSVYFFPLWVLSALGCIRPLATNLPAWPCKSHCCQVTSSQKTNPSCQSPASTTNTPELGHAFYSSPRHSRPRASADCCEKVQEDEVILQEALF